MSDESTTDEESDVPDRFGGGRRTPIIFVTDATAESARIADRLSKSGYWVIDVPLSMLASRAQVQRPNVVLLDIDASIALEEIAHLRRQPGAGAIDFVYIGDGEGKIRNAEDAIAHEGSAFFVRPVEIGALIRRIEALTGGPVADPNVRHSTPPPSLPPPRSSSSPSDRPSSASLPAPGLRLQGPPLPMSVPSLADLVDPPRSLSTFGTVSSELQQLLAEAEQRAEVMPHHEAPISSPEEEIESVLPADVLASLDEPIEVDEEEENEARPGVGGFDRGEGTGTHGKPTTAGGSRPPTTASERSAVQTNELVVGSDRPREAAPARRANEESRVHAKTPVPPSATEARTGELRLEHVTNATVDTRSSSASDVPARGPSDAPAHAPVAGIVVMNAVDSRRFLADAIARRLTGAICFEHERVVRRIVVRDGDLVTAASGAEQESLICFLGARGDLPRDEVERLAGKIPPYGRHAGAALVAHGWLGQDQLWSALRAHSEWIAAAVLRIGSGTVQLELEPPGRLRSEPSVFGASTGAELFVELVRRSVSPDDAIEALGGESSRLGDGPNAALLSECALAPGELDIVSRARGGTVRDLLARVVEPDIASVIHGLALLGVLDVIPTSDAPNQPSSARGMDREAAALDDEATRARIRARLELVDEGDYFSILGVSRDATSYEVRRAFVELRRAFEPTRILSPRLRDLAEDVRKIVLVLEEAYEILRDVARRERYRRAIDARPSERDPR